MKGANILKSRKERVKPTRRLPTSYHSYNRMRRCLIASSSPQAEDGIVGELRSKELFNNRKDIMSIIWIILIGFVVGLLAKMLTPGRDASGFFITAAIGIAGSLLATFGGQALGLYHAGEPAGFIGSLVGAIILLAIYHLVRRNSPALG